jgi:hypothetical protein
MSGHEKQDQLSIAAEKLYDDYLNDPELTIFSAIDGDDFIDFSSILSIESK